MDAIAIRWLWHPLQAALPLLMGRGPQRLRLHGLTLLLLVIKVFFLLLLGIQEHVLPIQRIQSRAESSLSARAGTHLLRYLLHLVSSCAVVPAHNTAIVSLSVLSTRQPLGGPLLRIGSHGAWSALYFPRLYGAHTFICTSMRAH